MKRRVWTILCALISIMLCALVFVACGGKGNNGNNGSDENGNNDLPPIVDTDDTELYERYAGVYYNDHRAFSYEYIVFTEDKIWYDNTGFSGKYTITEDGSSALFTMSADLTNNDVEYVSGEFIRSKYPPHDIYFSINEHTFVKSNKPVPECPKSLEYELSEDGKYYIIAGIGEAAGDIVVPKRYRFIPVKEIADRAFYNNRALTSVEVPETVTTIGKQAFAKCANLTSAKIESPVTELTEEFFDGCTKLVDVHIPKTVKEINYRAFKGCEKVKNVYYGGTVKDWASIKFGISASHASSNMGSEEPYWANPISGEGRRLIINDATVTTCELEGVRSGAFFQYKYLTSVEAASHVGDYAFYNSSITSFVGFGDIGVSAFENCSMLLSLELQSYSPSRLDYAIDIEDKAFCNCTQLASVSLGHARIVGEYAFAYCEKLTNITIPYHVGVIKRYAFSESGLENVSFESITDWIIEQNNEQKYVSVCDNSSKAAEYLTDHINGYVAYDWSISGIVFKLKDDGTYRVIPAVGSYNDVLGFVPNLSSELHISPAHLDIPSTYNGKAVTEIHGSFSLFPMLKSMFIPASVTKINHSLYVDILYCEVATRPDGQWGWVSRFNCNAYNQQFPTVWNCKNNDKDQDGYMYTVIDNVAYRLKDSVAEVYLYMPYPKNMKSLVIPKYVTYKTEKYKVSGICDDAFNGMNYRLVVDRIVIPDGVTSIGDRAFSFCFGSVEMPSSVTEIGAGAFYNGGMDIVFHGTKEQFNAINLGNGWYDYASLDIICENGQIKIIYGQVV